MRRAREPTIGCRRLRAAIAVIVFIASAPLARTVEAQGGCLVQGVGDLEIWKADLASSLLARGGGKTAPLNRAMPHDNG